MKVLALSYILAAAPGAFAFVTPTTQSQTVSKTQLFEYTPPTGFNPYAGIKDMPKGDEQRKLRRTVYSHDDWKKHRSQDRFLFYLAAAFSSGVYKNLGQEVALISSIATFVCIFNAVSGGYVDLNGVSHEALVSLPILGIPMDAFTLSSPPLGLLLVFRTNSSYKRWDEARKNWGMNINHTRDLVRMANAFYDTTGVSPEKRADDLNHVALCTWAFVRSMKRHLSPEEEDEADFKEEIFAKLSTEQAERIVNAAHRPNRALQDLSYAINDLPMHFLRKSEIQAAVTIFEDNLGSSERLLTSPVPLFYSRHLARYIAVWLLLLPFGLWGVFGGTWNHIVLIPSIAIISIMLLGIEEIGTQLEEPFTVLPMQAFCDKIYNWCMEIVSWSPGDNGRPTRPVRPEHAFFLESGTAPFPQVDQMGGAAAGDFFYSETNNGDVPSSIKFK